MKSNLLLTTAVLALSLAAIPARAPAQEAGGDQTRKPAAAQQGEGGEHRPGAARTPETGAPRRAEGGEAQRPAAGGAPAPSRPADAAGQRPAQNGAAASGTQPSDEAAHLQDQHRTGQTGGGEPGKAATGTNAGAPAARGTTGDAAQPKMQGGEKTGGAERPTENGNRAAARPESGKADTGRADAGHGAGKPRIEGRLSVNERDAGVMHDRLVGAAREAVTNVRIDVAVGARIPAEVTIREVPAEIVAQYPMFRGYDYVVSEERVVIIDPKSREVVEVIGGGGRAAAARPTFDAKRITTEQRQVIHRQVAVEPANRVVFDERTVHEVPDTIVLKPLPDAVITDVPDIRGYDYFVDSDDHVVLVDPDTREVVDVLD